MKKENKLLDMAYEIVDNKKFSDTCYEVLFNLFKNTTMYKRNNAKAILKRDLSLFSLMSDVVPLFGILVALVMIDQKDIDIAVMFFLVAILFFVYGKMLLPISVKINYIISIIEDVENKKL